MIIVYMWAQHLLGHNFVGVEWYMMYVGGTNMVVTFFLLCK